MPIQPDLSDRNRCVATHWELPVQCVLSPTHRDDHEAWHPESGNRIRFCGESVRPYTEELYHGKWTRLHGDRSVAPAAAIGNGLADLFQRIGPPADRTAEK
ncbi:hypothetical protein [Streptomyces pseudovenezuelae]|uniref:hypothetical protein n=1 Tax=Streptomyces pseudovenezuelae TaxID=67350 RepID=UPI0036EB57F2